MGDGADLHIHSNASDGALSPAEILAEAIKKGLEAVAITGHDTLAGWKVADASPLSQEILLLPALEINTEVQQKEVHILGYCFRETELLERELEELRQARWERAKKMLGKLQDMGLEVSWASLLRLAGEAAPGRLHLARALVECGEASSIRQAFAAYLLPGGPAYVPRHRLTPQEAIFRIRAAGGVAVLAHPGTGVSDELITLLADEGLQGLEVYHPAHNASDIVHYLRLAEHYDLLVTGGSDYHGFEPGISCIGKWTVPMESIEKLYRLRN